DVGNFLMKERPVDIAYLTTTDFAMHMNAPDHPDAIRHMAILDDAIGRLAANHPDASILVTADHGMNAKSEMVDLKAVLSARGIESNPVAIIKDRYVLHHSNLGGCMYVYLDPANVSEAMEVLRETPGVDDALTREESAARFDLSPELIGDIVVTADPHVVFGDADEVSLPDGLRSHGSVHERDVPIVGYNGDFDGFEFRENRDAGRYVFERVLA
ncbi:MAG: alkaline phosphatase family protein, partial [Alphaproteobacteria bacterium]|nr:alkaline phosphatase family protein [Alphaproteobacteria bacterium]